MKKIFLIIVMMLVFPVASYAETCTSQSAGNWFTAATWDCPPTGAKVPVSGDDVVLNHAVVWDVATGAGTYVIPATGRLGTITAGAGGSVTIDAAHANCTPSPDDNTVKANTVCKMYFTTATANGLDLIVIDDGTGTTSDNAVLIDGTECKGSTAASKACITHNAIRVMLFADIALTGSASGYGGTGLKINANGALATTTKNITGGGYNSAYGLNNVGNSSSIVTVSSGAITGGSVSGGDGINNGTASADAVVISSGATLVNSAQASSIRGPFIWNATAAAGSWSIDGKFYGQCPLAAKVGTDTTVLNNSTGVFDTGTLSGGGGAWGF